MKARYIVVVLWLGITNFGARAACKTWDDWIAPTRLTGQCQDAVSLVWQGQTDRIVQARYQLLPSTSLVEPMPTLWQAQSVTSMHSDWLARENDDLSIFIHRGLLPKLAAKSSNITVPLATTLSRKLLPSMERYEVQSSLLKGPITVISGVIGQHQIEAVYKILVHQDSMAHIAFVFPNQETTSDKLTDYVTTIHCIEALTGYSVVKNPTKFSDWKYSLAFDLSIWTQGGTASKHECPQIAVNKA